MCHLAGKDVGKKWSWSVATSNKWGDLGQDNLRGHQPSTTVGVFFPKSRYFYVIGREWLAHVTNATNACRNALPKGCPFLSLMRSREKAQLRPMLPKLCTYALVQYVRMYVHMKRLCKQIRCYINGMSNIWCVPAERYFCDTCLSAKKIYVCVDCVW